jgi:hypothetical protein
LLSIGVFSPFLCFKETIMIVVEYENFYDFGPKKVFPDLKAKTKKCSDNSCSLLLLFKHTSILAEELHGGHIWTYYCKFEFNNEEK